ncbi:TniQ family protein [Bradyrhizobium genosp. P]|uniref:TniQ family protein n=1 Tax=Bradyrhizobium genosp. P TaxID=83641 RepID=UPI003CF91B6A
MAPVDKSYSPLPRWITPAPFEPPHGCLLRLAECNGLRGTQEVRHFTGLNVGSIRTGKDLEQLAAVLHCDVEELRANATIHKNNARAVVGFHVLRPDADLTRLSVRRVCPACLIESSHHRVWWDWSFVSTCPSHSCMLVDRCSCGNGLSWADGSVTKCRECDEGDVRKIVIEPAHPRMTAPDRWAIDRFVGAGEFAIELLDGVPLGYAAELVKRIGTLDLFGYRATWPQLAGAEEIRNVRARGFELVASGTIEIALEHAYEGYQSISADPAPSLSRMYGWFYQWFQSNGGARLFHRMGERLLKHASSKIQVTRRAFHGLGRPSTGPVTLSEAASMAKIRTGTMRKLLTIEGLIRSEQKKGVPVLVERAIAERVAWDIAESLTLSGLENHLGLGRKALLKLVRSGLIPTWVTGGFRGQHSYIFRKAEIAMWFEDLLGKPPTLEVPPADAVCVADAFVTCLIPATVLVCAIGRREISVLGICGKRRNFKSALVKCADVLEYKVKIGAAAAHSKRE